MSAPHDYEDYDDFTDDEDDGWDDLNCQWMPGTGQCMAAGSEDCDFECPYRDDYQRESERLYREQAKPEGEEKL